MNTPLFGALFDWDGVIVDSSSHHEESWELLAVEESKVLPTDHFKRGFGMKNEVIIPQLLGWTCDEGEIRRLSLRKEELYRDVVRQRGLTPLPGVVKLLAALQAAGIPRIIGSSTHRLNISTALNTLQLDSMFDGVVTAEDVSNGKPDPEVFLKAAVLSGCPPERCIVFEDALVGIQAANAAGIAVVAVATTNPIEILRHADLAVERLTEITLDRLRALLPL
jgi:HAD superfamily hydrolase (TIGR01509 family)